MTLLPNTIFDIVSGSICAALILGRCTYRVFFPCHAHKTCHRRWRTDDTYMTLALFPIIARTVMVAELFHLNPSQSNEPVTAAEAAAQGMSVEQMTADRVLSHKLLIPSRLTYALFLWMLKLSLLAFYSRFIGPLDWGRAVIRTLWWVIVSTYTAVLLATLLECRPLSLTWKLAPDDERPQCAKAVINLVTMAVFNIITDLALIILPYPMLRHVRLDKQKRLHLVVLFGVGAIVVVITITRLPLTIIQSVSQRSRSMWASIEMLCACAVTNAAFYYKIAKDLKSGTHGQQPNSSPQRGFYLQTIPSSSACEDVEGGAPERPKAGYIRTEDVHDEEGRLYPGYETRNDLMKG